MRRTICILILLCTALTATAQRSRQQRPGSGLSDLFEDLSGRNRFAWEYDVDFQYVLDNRAFGASWDGYTPSGTLHSVVLTPTAGFSIQQNRRVHHRLTAGIEFAYDMGVQSWRDLPRELILYYDGHARTRNGSFEGLAGIFPRRFLEGNYSEAFYSDSTKFNDRNLEGALLKWRSDRYYAEVGLDWTGKTSPLKRERVQVIILSDTFEQFAMPLMKKLGWPTLLCNTLEVAENGEITGYRMRCEKSKLSTVRALQSIGYKTIASGDSFNDIGMIVSSQAGFLFRTTDQLKKDYSQYPAYETYDELLGAIRSVRRASRCRRITGF